MSAALARAERYAATLKRLKDEGKNTARRAVQSAATVTGGFVSGVIEAKMPTIGSSNVPTAAVAGGTVLGIGLLGFADKYSDAAVAAGAGMLAGEARELGRNLFAG